MKKTVAIIGSGAVGANIAIFLSKLGVEVSLFDSEEDILHGASVVSFINHGDGFEYYKKDHQTTGKHCIDGSIAKGLIYPLRNFQTQTISEDNPIRFLVSDGAVKNNITPLRSFYLNAEAMKQHFTKQYLQAKKIKGWTDEQAKKIFLRTPKSFYKKLSPDNYTDLNHIAGGCYGSSFGINMPHYFAYLKSAMRHTNVSFYGERHIDCIEKNGGEYLIHTSKGTCNASHIIVAANHQIPLITQLTKNFNINPLTSGTYYLNSMTIIELPPTSDENKIKDLTHINFTLQGEYGAMFACILPPTKTEPGIAAIYYPSFNGSQLYSTIYNRSNPTTTNPEYWEPLIKNGISNSNTNVLKTFDQACHFYPFLKNYAKIKKTVCRTVFNASVASSLKGTDRRVREIIDKPLMLSDDGRITMWTSPKWTNAELVALMATDYIGESIGLPRLPKSEKHGLGPACLDVVNLSNSFNFHNLPMEIEDANKYADVQGISRRIVNKDLFS